MTAPAGWYPTHDDPTSETYWDGAAWTDQKRVKAAELVMTPPPPVVPAPLVPAQGGVPAQLGTPGHYAQPLVTKQGAWGLWWLCIVTLNVYYFVWYHRINREICAVLNQPVPANGQWWNQLIPFWNLVGLGASAKRLNAAHAAVGSPTRVGIFTAWFWAPVWYASQTRYLQRRVNILHDVLAGRAAR